MRKTDPQTQHKGGGPMLRIKLTIVSALMTLMLAGCGGGGQHAGTLIGGGVGTALALDFVLHDEVKIYDRYEQRMKMVPRDRRFTWYEKAAIVAAFRDHHRLRRKPTRCVPGRRRSFSVSRLPASGIARRRKQCTPLRRGAFYVTNNTFAYRSGILCGTAPKRLLRCVHRRVHDPRLLQVIATTRIVCFLLGRETVTTSPCFFPSNASPTGAWMDTSIFPAAVPISKIFFSFPVYLHLHRISDGDRLHRMILVHDLRNLQRPSLSPVSDSQPPPAFPAPLRIRCFSLRSPYDRASFQLLNYFYPLHLLQFLQFPFKGFLLLRGDDMSGFLQHATKYTINTPRCQQVRRQHVQNPEIWYICI